MKNELLDSITLGSGVCSNLALNALKNKNLNKEKPKSLAYIAESMGKLAQGNPLVNINLNTSMPTNREDLIKWLSKPAEIVGNTNIPDIPNKPIDVDGIDNE
jgi:hypothetical protein